MLRNGVAILAALFLGACSLSPSGAGNPNRVPKWVDEPPHDDQHIYAVGNYVGALFPEDNRKYAFQAAMHTLAVSVRATVLAVNVVENTDTSSRSRSETQVSTDANVEGAEHIDTWTDANGLRGDRGGEWILVRIRRPGS